MLKHIVMYKLKQPTQQNIDKLIEVFMSMQGKIDTLISIKAGYDIVKSPRSFDVVLECEFESLEDLQAYGTHPVHIPIIEYAKTVIEKSISIDYIF